MVNLPHIKIKKMKKETHSEWLKRLEDMSRAFAETSMTNKEISTLTEIDRSYLSKIKRGIAIPRLTTVNRIMDVLKPKSTDEKPE